MAVDGPARVTIVVATVETVAAAGERLRDRKVRSVLLSLIVGSVWNSFLERIAGLWSAEHGETGLYCSRGSARYLCWSGVYTHPDCTLPRTRGGKTNPSQPKKLPATCRPQSWRTEQTERLKISAITHQVDDGMILKEFSAKAQRVSRGSEAR